MTSRQAFEILQWRSLDDEARFFASMGRFFASATVRRDCGGYPLSDGPYHRWFILRRPGDSRVLGFISLEQRSGEIRIRDGYLRAEARGRGLFRALRRQVLDYIDELGLACITRVPNTCAQFLEPHGFDIQTSRGAWVTLRRKANDTTDEPDGESRSTVSRTGCPAACRAD